jgi:hypothetical protein
MAARFEVYSRSELIGWSELEHRDPPMGVAFGRFVPAPAYSKVQSKVRASLEAKDRLGAQASLQLVVRTPAGAMLKEIATIADASDKYPDNIELELLGVPDYSTHFSEVDASDA